MAPTNPVATYGFAALPAASSAVVPSNPSPPPPYPVSSTPLPTTPLAKRIHTYASQHLPRETLAHSLRVYHYGRAIQLQHFPDWAVSDETYFLTCMLHDIGTTDANIESTRLSFEFWGGYKALDVLQNEGGEEARAPREQAESVAEAVIRHQDVGDRGKVTTLTQLIQLATIFDNIGLNANLVNKSTIEDVVQHYPRNKWSHCFASTIRKENGLKPGAHTTKLGEDDFPNGVLGNKLMEPYE